MDILLANPNNRNAMQTTQKTHQPFDEQVIGRVYLPRAKLRTYRMLSGHALQRNIEKSNKENTDTAVINRI